MAPGDWNQNYADGFLPWDTGTVDPMLVETLATGVAPVGRALDVGCGTGTNAIWLAERGYDVLGVDLAPLAIARADGKRPAGLTCRFATADFLAAPPATGCQLVFDRGCFHTFDDPAERATFAAHVAAALAPDGVWISLIGSTEGPPRTMGPPRRTAREVLDAIEPHLALVSLRSAEFRDGPEPARAWILVAGRRAVPAVPSSRH